MGNRMFDKEAQPNLVQGARFFGDTKQPDLKVASLKSRIAMSMLGKKEVPPTLMAVGHVMKDYNSPLFELNQLARRLERAAKAKAYTEGQARETAAFLKRAPRVLLKATKVFTDKDGPGMKYVFKTTGETAHDIIAKVNTGLSKWGRAIEATLRRARIPGGSLWALPIVENVAEEGMKKRAVAQGKLPGA